MVEKKLVWNINEVFENAPEAAEYNQMVKSIQEREDKELIDENYIRMCRDWSILSGQVPGYEVN